MYHDLDILLIDNFMRHFFGIVGIVEVGVEGEWIVGVIENGILWLMIGDWMV
jgi:hypothetical protein